MIFNILNTRKSSNERTRSICTIFMEDKIGSYFWQRGLISTEFEVDVAQL